MSLPRTLTNVLFQSLNWKYLHLAWVPRRPPGKQLTDLPQCRHNSRQSTVMETSLYQKAWGFDELKGLGLWLLEMARQGESICLPAWQQLSLAGMKALTEAKQSWQWQWPWAEAVASQHQHGASLQTAQAKTKDGGKTRACPASRLAWKLESRARLMGDQSCSKTLGSESGMQSESFPDDSSLHNGFAL